MSSPLRFPVGRGALPRLGACLLLAVLTTLACRLLLDSLFGPGTWATPLLCRLAPATGPGRVLVHRCSCPEKSAHSIAPPGPIRRPPPSWRSPLLLASAAVLTSCTDLAFEWGASVGSPEAGCRAPERVGDERPDPVLRVRAGIRGHVQGRGRAAARDTGLRRADLRDPREDQVHARGAPAARSAQASRVHAAVSAGSSVPG